MRYSFTNHESLVLDRLAVRPYVISCPSVVYPYPSSTSVKSIMWLRASRRLVTTFSHPSRSSRPCPHRPSLGTTRLAPPSKLTGHWSCCPPMACFPHSQGTNHPSRQQRRPVSGRSLGQTACYLDLCTTRGRRGHFDWCLHRNRLFPKMSLFH